MEKYIETLHKIFYNNVLVSSTISNKRQKEQEYDKIKVRPVLIKEELKFQFEYFSDTKVIHKNLDKNTAIEAMKDLFKNVFKQGEFVTKKSKILIRFSKKDKILITEKQNREEKNINIKHNIKKNYIINEGSPVDFLVELGIMTKEGKVKSNKYKKFKQINRYIEIIDDIIKENKLEKEINIIDFGCGKSYLTFALYYYLKKIKDYNIEITGIDLKEDVVKHCNELSKKLGYKKLHFIHGDISKYDSDKKIHMVISLHACDTATDYALGKAVEWGTNVILAVPCCQHEINSQIENKTLSSILEYGIIKERFSALLTDVTRALLLRIMGYKVQVLEFIDLEHTPKNILIRSIKNDKSNKDEALNEYIKLKEFFNINPTLEKLLKIDI